MAKIIVGIDFGTSTTVVRWRKEDSDEIHVIKDSNGHTVIDSSRRIVMSGFSADRRPVRRTEKESLCGISRWISSVPIRMKTAGRKFM